MRILQIHNFYKIGGGEDSVLHNEYHLLVSNGHIVEQFLVYNSSIENSSILQKIILFITSIYSITFKLKLKRKLLTFKPDICHIHNTFPLISPSVYYACSKLNIPVIQTLHNFRLVCSNAYLFRDGHACLDCIGKSLYNSVPKKCYHNSFLDTLFVSNIIMFHRFINTWNSQIDQYIVLNNFSKKIFIECGIDKNLLTIKPNFIFNDPGISNNDGAYFFYAGRLDKFKGVNVLYKAFEDLNYDLKIAGTGNSYPSKEIPNIEFLGQVSHDEILCLIKNSYLVIYPTLLFENMPMLIIEAFACGKCVIASNVGASKEMVEDGFNGLLFNPNDIKHLIEKLVWSIQNRDMIKTMSRNARLTYEKFYSKESNYTQLLNIYTNSLNRKNIKYEH